MPKVICIDLDGTILEYEDWIGEDSFGEVLPNAKYALQELKSKGYTIIIYTTRSNKELISGYLNSKSIPFDYINENPNQPVNAIGGKPLADIYIDDRALQFNGNWNETLEKISVFKTWNEIEKEKIEQKEYGKQFLFHDFEQCFQQMRHYDSQSWDIIKFCFGEVLLAITAIWALYCFSESSENLETLVSNHFNWLVIIILFISYLFVFVSSYLVARNRVYYVKTSRYVNELRKLALDTKPYGFENAYNFYSNYHLPKVNAKRSTQLIALYSLLALGMLCCAGMIMALVSTYINLSFNIIFVGLISLLIGYIPLHFGCIRYLKRENAKMMPKV